MKITQLILPVVALSVGSAFLLTGSQEAHGWSTLGGSLSQSQRDFRIYNNFSDGSDNNNQTPDPQFPGYQGADMAIWKGCIEWSSIAHGDGSGDSTQNQLGGSGANFDPSFQGNATGTGNSNQNIHSQISGSGGGALAYCETPISDGWRIRYYQGINWADGPGTIGNNQYDLQGVACHEYGHALGLGHSTNGGATMYPSVANGNEGIRSINNDDMAGCQAVYGSISGTKPTITNVSVNGNTITVTGTGFDSSGNEIWFTQAGTGSNGTPIKATGLTSNGTTLTATIPAAAGPGDILARRNNGGHGGLSNPWPSDLEGGGGTGCNDPQVYCGTSPNSVGPGATIGFTGSASQSTNDFQLNCSGLVPGTPGLFFYGPNQTAVLLGEGVRCVDGQLTRLDVQVADILGTVVKPINWFGPPFLFGTGAVAPGDDVNFQYWYRDVPGGPSGYNLSSAVGLTLCD